MSINISKKLINNIMDYFVDTNSSDLHIGYEGIFIRNKIGNLEKLDQELDQEEIKNFAKSLLSEEKFNILIKGHEIDFGYSYKGERFRMNFFYSQEGMNIAIRKLATNIPNLKEISLPEYLNPFYLKNKGLILVTGPTGSGKSTTLASIVSYINENKNCHIITLEDPIEYIIKSKKSLVHQREVGSNTNNWLDGIKYALRQDPDVVIVGEMRDLETIEAVLTLVETGHLVISTLHTIDTVQTITRIVNSFSGNEQNKISMQLSMVLELVISQRLLPQKDGKGRICAREIMINNNAIANLIRQNKIAHIYGVIETQRQSGMVTMDQSLAKFVSQGIIDKNEALALVNSSGLFNQMVEFYNQFKQEGSKSTVTI